MATSGTLSARIFSNNKKINSPEGVAVLTSTVFIDFLVIIAFAVISGIVILTSGKTPYAVSANIFLIITLTGAYIAGLSLSMSIHVAIIQERFQRAYEFFIPVLFAFIGMMVNIGEILTLPALIFGIVLSLVIVFAKIAGGGGPALLLGYNFRGSLRIGAGMIPCGELALMIAGIGLVQGIFNQQLFAAVILMAFITTILAAALQNLFLRLSGSGTRRPVKGDDSVSTAWKFLSPKIANHIRNMLLKELRLQGFYIQIIGVRNGFFQARKNDIALSIIEEANSITVETARTDLPFVKAIVSGVINSLHESIQELYNEAHGKSIGDNVFSLITPDCISVALRGSNKKEIIAELVDILAIRRKLLDRDLVLHDILEREKTMSTGMQHGIALPHAKTDGVNALAIAIGITKEGVDFESIDGSKTKLVILMVSSTKTSGPHVQFLAAISALLKNDALREAVINAQTPEEVSRLLRTDIHSV
jgi:mannitol/fructose-specific phosphotransferase system IIA component (Ntr-type)